MTCYLSERQCDDIDAEIVFEQLSKAFVYINEDLKSRVEIPLGWSIEEVRVKFVE